MVGSFESDAQPQFCSDCEIKMVFVPGTQTDGAHFICPKCGSTMPHPTPLPLIPFTAACFQAFWLRPHPLLGNQIPADVWLQGP